jgi:hypothetical protein
MLPNTIADDRAPQQNESEPSSQADLQVRWRNALGRDNGSNLDNLGTFSTEH